LFATANLNPLWECL